MKEQSELKGFGKAVFLVSQTMNRVACAVLFGMMLLTTADVFGRKAFSHSILGTVELSEFMLGALVFLSLSHTEFMDGHVKVDLFMMRFSERAKAAIDMITQFIGFLISGICAWSGFAYAAKMRFSGEVSQDLWLPKYPFIYLVVLGFAILSLTMLIRFFLACRKAVRP